MVTRAWVDIRIVLAPSDGLGQVDSLQNFTWQQQLRYYWDMELDDCLIRHSDAKIRYGYEYMGATRCD